MKTKKKLLFSVYRVYIPVKLFGGNVSGSIYSFPLERLDIDSLFDLLSRSTILEKYGNGLIRGVSVLVAFYCIEIDNQGIGRLDTGLTLVIENHGIPELKGLGGSAALCNSVAAALLLCFYPNVSYQQVNEWAFRGEVLFHHQPSGIDNTVSCLGRYIRFFPIRWSTLLL